MFKFFCKARSKMLEVYGPTDKLEIAPPHILMNKRLCSQISTAASASNCNFYSSRFHVRKKALKG